MFTTYCYNFYKKCVYKFIHSKYPYYYKIKYIHFLSKVFMYLNRFYIKNNDISIELLDYANLELQKYNKKKLNYMY